MKYVNIQVTVRDVEIVINMENGNKTTRSFAETNDEIIDRCIMRWSNERATEYRLDNMPKAKVWLKDRNWFHTEGTRIYFPLHKINFIEIVVVESTMNVDFEIDGLLFPRIINKRLCNKKLKE